jgi:uncharacterized protein (TIRG00374 family)
MAESSFLKRRWKLILNIVTLVALAVLIFAIRHQLGQTLHDLAKVQVWALLLMIPLQLMNYDAQTRLYRALFRLVGHHFRYRDLFGAALELNFVNHVFPSGGVTGISYFGARLKSPTLSGSRATVVQLMKLVLLFVSFEVLLFIGVGLLAITGNVNNITILVAGSLTTLVVVGTLAMVFVLGSKNRINTVLLAIVRGVNRLIALVRPDKTETIKLLWAREVFDSLHDNYRLIVSQLPALKKPFLYALVANVAEILTIYVVYLAFGHWVNIGAVILAYAVANFAGLVSVLPGGVGIYEALMTAVLIAAGVPASLSVSVTVMYRVLSTLIQLPPGYVLYHRALHGQGVAISEETAKFERALGVDRD